MEKFIAERKLIFVPKGTKERRDLVIRIGMPYWVEEDVAGCPVEWGGLFEELVETRGGDLLQALHLAADIDPLLEKLRSKYDFYWPSGESYHEDDVHLEGSTSAADWAE